MKALIPSFYEKDVEDTGSIFEYFSVAETPDIGTRSSDVLKLAINRTKAWGFDVTDVKLTVQPCLTLYHCAAR